MSGCVKSVRPGALEAKAIQRDFEWRRKLRSLKLSLKSIDEDLRGSRLRESDISQPNDPKNFDAEDAIRSLESEGVNRWELNPNPVHRHKYKKLLEAIESLSKPYEIDSRGVVNIDATANEWSEFAKMEEERREHIQASYKRCRGEGLTECHGPQTELFDYEEVDFPLPSGETIKQPVAHFRDSPRLTNSYHLTDVMRASDRKFNVATNTVINEWESIEDARKSILPESQLENQDRDSYVAYLVEKTKSKPVILNSGDRVGVVYYGLTFPGTVVSRNMGAGTITVRFDDNTVNDFPIHTIVQ